MFNPNAMPVVFVNPFNHHISAMPVEMINAYVDDPEYTGLNLAEAAKVACIRDDEAAQNLLLSIVENAQPEIEMPIPEGVGRDELSVEAPSLR